MDRATAVGWVERKRNPSVRVGRVELSRTRRGPPCVRPAHGRSTHPTEPPSPPHCVLATIGLPSMNLILLMFQAPPGAPLRSGSMVRRNSSPGFSDLLVQPSRARALGLPPSRFHASVVPSLSLMSRMMKECGLVYLNSLT